MQELQYNDALTGTRRLYGALAGFFNSYFNPVKPVTIEQIITGSGASPVINNFFRAVANKGDGVLIVAPYYVGFDMDLTIINGVLPIGVPIPRDQLFTAGEVTCLEQHLERTQAAGVKIKAIILCNPHNPIGQCYPPEVIIKYAQLCEKHNLHLLSDEIYALSVFPSEERPHPEAFVSALSIDFTKHAVNPARVHVLYGMSKDFNSNSLRVGVLVSQHNPEALLCITTTLLFSMVAAPSGILWAKLLNDKAFLSEFIIENQKQLRQAYEHVTKWLRFQKIPYIPSNAGHFLMIDFSGILSDAERYGALIPFSAEMDMTQREQALMLCLLQHKLFIGSGASFHMPQPGWLRLTFSIPRKTMNVGLRRIEDMLRWESSPDLFEKV